jgi:hypothetical protein
MVGGTDVAQWLQREAPPTLPAQLPADETFFLHPEIVFGWKPAQLAVARVIKWMYFRQVRPVKRRYRSGRWVARARAMRAAASEVRTTVPDPSPMLDHFERHFRSLLVQAKAHADRVLVVRQPWFEKERYTSQEESRFWHGGVGDPCHGERIRAYYSFEVVSRLMRLMDERAACVAAKLKVEHLDLMPLLEPSLRTFYDFVHFTPAGAKAVAEAVADAILAPAAAPRVYQRMSAACS